ncbi:hypothetical protein [Burkholderia sp. L27(2015)]|uniref:hypothetical protein n=1 Tax=Burkholderia sp. L27(2015) TaxID=1641858 RepID=UPI00131E820E|nr:hypothetical protein [Burkholderia sp. L27(2015)]
MTEIAALRFRQCRALSVRSSMRGACQQPLGLDGIEFQKIRNIGARKGTPKRFTIDNGREKFMANAEKRIAREKEKSSSR